MNSDLLGKIIFTIVLGIIAGISAYKLKFLTKSGAIAASILAILLYGFGGLKWLLPMIIFFILSSLLSKLRKKVNPKVETYFEKSGTRDHIQVLANGGAGGVLVIISMFYEPNLIYLAYIGLLSVVCSDTWATEFGTLLKVKTYNIINFKSAEQGVSGGVSLLGFIGAIFGPAVIAFTSHNWVGGDLVEFIMIVIFIGLLGNLFDSIMGSLFQAKYECIICGLVTEKKLHCNAVTIRISGIRWLNNDLVNLVAGLSGSVLIILFQKLL